MQIAMNELKAGLSSYVARARSGEVIVITSHDKPVARLIGAPADVPQGLAGLVASGDAQWAGGKPADFQPLALPGHARSMADRVLEDRG